MTMGQLMLTFAISLAILMGGMVATFRATEGATAFTTETLRRTAVAASPALVPDFMVIDASAGAQPLHARLARGGEGHPDGRVWIVDFIYTRCMTLCLSLGTVFQQLQRQILVQGLQQQVGLLSISFDPANDRPAELADYARRMNADSSVWEMVSLQEPQDRRRLLDSFGIMVVPGPFGEFEHNAALHVVAPDGRLMRILDLAESAEALNLAVSLHAARTMALATP